MKRVLLLVLTVLALRSTALADEATQWQRWDKVVVADAKPDDATRPMPVVFTGPAGRTIRVFAFPAGKSIAIRAAFPVSGEWTWQVAMSDDASKPPLTGKVTVAAYHGDNPLYTHGMLKVEAGKRYLMYDDGTPFFWLGDTCWLANWKLSLADWKIYIDRRREQGFTVIQVHATTYGLKPGDHNAAGLSPYDATGLPSAAYWSAVDEKIAYANQRGLVVLVVGLGKSGKDDSGKAVTPAFAHAIAGRMLGSFVVLSPSMDSTFDESNATLASLLKESTSVNLITQHPGTDLPAIEKYHADPHLDFTAVQSGHANGNVNNAFGNAQDWLAKLYGGKPIRPIVNIEAMYDGRGSDEGTNWREADARRLGWTSVLSGSAGYTYGAGETEPHVKGSTGGTWHFGGNPKSYDYWRKAIDWNSARQMTYMKDFFADLPWWQLEPAPQRAGKQPKTRFDRVTMACTHDCDCAVVYAPDDRNLNLDLRGFPKPTRVTWFNPVTNEWLKLSDTVPTGQMGFTHPSQAGWKDAVLLLTK